MKPVRYERTYQFKALTDLWTGSIMDKNGQVKEKPVADRLITTGLLGSIRWWFEVLVRGLGGSACDPTDTKCEDRNHCVVRELFGCTGWARKFRFQVLDKNGEVEKDQVTSGKIFKLHFISFRSICPEEWALLELTLRLIAGFGAVGGKTVYKPSDEPVRQSASQHKDYGLIERCNGCSAIGFSQSELKKYLQATGWRRAEHGEFDWASLKHFWSVQGKYLARQNINESTFNCILNRPEPKKQSTQNDSWIAGFRADKAKEINPKSKKVFSFKYPARTFGFIEKLDDEHWNSIKHSLNDLRNSSSKWNDFDLSKNFLMGNQVLENLFRRKE